MSDTPRCYRHPDRETLVSCSECGRPICEECMTFAPVGIRCPDHATVSRGPRPSPTQRARRVQQNVRTSAAPATMALVAINVVVYVITVVQGGGLNAPGGSLFEKGALVGVLVSDGEWWRLVGAMFLHASVIHLAFNMFALYWLGSIVEATLGTGRYLLVYFAAGLAGSAGALVFSNPLAITVGASGAIFGLMGALLILEYLSTGSFAGPALTLIILNLVITFAIPNISVGGHLGGLVGGALATLALTKLRYVRPSYVAPAVVVLIGVLSVVVAYVRVENYTF
jgi:membrane associated rhomboid family serine protease